MYTTKGEIRAAAAESQSLCVSLALEIETAVIDMASSKFY
jgi:hypothetical protein